MVGQQVASSAASFWFRHSVTAAAATSTAAAMVISWPIWIVFSLINLDNAWLVVADRARQAGTCLAHVLADRQAVGQRPVTLIGHSMGARLIFYCLLELYNLGEFHVVDDVVLVGAPVTTLPERWRKARAVASGRVINCYLPTDWVLAF